MARSERDIIDFSALERELRGAIESEQRHKRENETKLRAVGQRVCYEQFRDLVSSSHLKPLEKKDKDGAPRKQPWNPVAPSNRGGPVAPSNRGGPVAPSDEDHESSSR